MPWRPSWLYDLGHVCSTWRLAFIGQAVSEKKAFEYFGNIHVYSPGVVAEQPLGSKVF